MPEEILSKPRMRTQAHYFYFGIDKFSYPGTTLHNACSEKVGKIEKNRGKFRPLDGVPWAPPTRKAGARRRLPSAKINTVQYDRPTPQLSLKILGP